MVVGIGGWVGGWVGGRERGWEGGRVGRREGGREGGWVGGRERGWEGGWVCVCVYRLKQFAHKQAFSQGQYYSTVTQSVQL